MFSIAQYSEELLDACRRGDYDNAHDALVHNSILYERADPSFRDQRCRTALHYAAAAGSTRIIELLCGINGLDVDIRDENGENAVHVAAAANQVPALRQLLSTGRFDVDATTKMNLTALHCAVQHNHLGTTLVLIHEFGASAWIVDSYHDTVIGWATGKRSHLQSPLSAYIENCLLKAVSSDNVGVVLDILDSGVFGKKRSLNPNACNEDGWTALHIAASFDAVEMMQILVDKLPIDVNAIDNAGDTALHKAARNGFIDSITFLRFVVECDDSIVNDRQERALDIVPVTLKGQLRQGVNSFDSEALRDAVVQIENIHKHEKMIDPEDGEPKFEFESSFSDVWETPEETLVRKCIEGDFDGVRECIQSGWIFSGADVHYRDNKKWTALHFAVRYGRLRIARYLIEQCGADPEKKEEDGLTPLHISAAYNHLNCVEYLVKSCKVDINARCEMLRTPLHIASEHNSAEVVRFFVIDCQVFLWSLDRHQEAAIGWAPRDSETFAFLHDVYQIEVFKAVYEGNAELLKGMIAFFGRGIDINEKDERGLTCFHIAVATHAIDIMQILASVESLNVDTQDEKGNTPLHLAVRTSEIQAVKLLVLQLNADMNIPDAHGKTAIQNAQGDVRELLEDLLAHSESALLKACRRGDMDAVLLSLSEAKFAEPPRLDCRDRHGRTPLHLACRSRNIQLVHCLLTEFSCDLDATDEMGMRALDELHDTADRKRLDELLKVLGFAI